MAESLAKNISATLGVAQWTCASPLVAVLYCVEVAGASCENE
jgi:hypothetical protein